TWGAQPPRNNRGGGRGFSDVEEDVDHVAVLHDVRLSLGAEAAPLARLGEAARLHEVVVRHDLGADEAAGEVRMDDRSGRERRVPATDRPGADFVLSGSQER